MFIITVRTYHPDAEPMEEKWGVRDEKPDIDVSRIITLSATCDEWCHVCDRFTNIPLSSKGSGTTWYGDIARTIFLNL